MMTQAIVTGPGREAAKECSPRRKPWVCGATVTEPRRGERKCAFHRPKSPRILWIFILIATHREKSTSTPLWDANPTPFGASKLQD